MTIKMINQGLLIALLAIAFACTKSNVINESEKEWLKNHPDLSIGISPNQPPYQFISEEGEIKGMFIDFLTAIEDRLDYKFEKIYQPDWTKLLSDAKEGNIDIVLQIQETDERKDFLKFTPFLLSHKHVFVTKNTRDDIASVSDLKDKKIAVAHSYAVLDYLLKNYPDFSIQPLFDNVAGLRAVATGQADAFVTQQAVVTYYFETEGISNLKIAGEIDYPNELAIASRKDLDTLNIILSKAVNSITKTEKQTIYNRWLSYEVKPFYAEVKFWIVILVVILVALVLVILFNLALRKRVKQKTNELKVAKEKVEENYALMRIAGEKAKLGWWNVDLKGNRAYWSDVVAAIHEMPPEYSPLVEDGINFYAPEWREKINKVFTECAQYGIPYDEEMEIITSTGKRVWVRTIGEAVRNEEGEIFKVEGAFQDITQRKLAENKVIESQAELKKALEISNQSRQTLLSVLEDQTQAIKDLHISEERLRLATEQSNVAVWEYDFNSNSMSRSSNHDKLYGLEWQSKWDIDTFLNATHSEDREYSNNFIQNSVAPGGPDNYSFDFRVVFPDNSIRWLTVNGRVIERNKSGQGIKVRGTLTDITEQKNTELVLTGMSRIMNNSQEIAHLGSFEFVAATQTTIWSEEEYRIYGLDPNGPSPEYNEMLEKCIHPDDAKLLHDAFMAAIQNQGVYELEHRIVRPDGSVRWVYDKAHPYFDEHGNLLRYVGATLDTTDRKRLQEELEILNTELEKKVEQRTAQLEASNKELEAFSYSVSHDLRAPLRHINGFVELLSNQFKDELPDKAHHYLDTISGASRQMGNLIDELLQYSRTGRQEVTKTQVDMNLLVKEVTYQLITGLEERKINWDIQQLPKVSGDIVLLKQVWANLLDNAVKYTRNQKTTEISVGCREETKEFVFWVKDNGAGFEMKYAHKLFGVFQRLHSKTEFEGTGIGLANVQRIVHKHLGRVWAEAEPGKGAKFYFSLPKYQEETR